MFPYIPSKEPQGTPDPWVPNWIPKTKEQIEKQGKTMDEQNKKLKNA